MTLPKPNRNQLAVGVAVVIALAIVGGIAWGFGQQLSLGRQMRAEEKRLEQAVADEEAHHDDLVAQLEYVKSDEHVENWARTEMKMARPGEVAVVPLVSAGEELAGDAQPTPTPVPESRSFWVKLRESLFGPAGP